MNYPSHEQARRDILEVGRRMYNRGYVVANDGNITCKVSDDALWTTPTGVSKGFMSEDMLILVDLDGKVLQGSAKPSSELKMHLRVYRENPEIRACVHAHPTTASSFAVAGLALDRPILPEGIMMLGEVPVAPYATPGTQEVPDSIAPYCKSHNAVLLANHGALTWGSDLMQAYMRMESLENYAKVILYTDYIIGRANELTDSQIDAMIAQRTASGVATGGRPTRRIG